MIPIAFEFEPYELPLVTCNTLPDCPCGRTEIVIATSTSSSSRFVGTLHPVTSWFKGLGIDLKRPETINATSGGPCFVRRRVIGSSFMLTHLLL